MSMDAENQPEKELLAQGKLWRRPRYRHSVYTRPIRKSMLLLLVTLCVLGMGGFAYFKLFYSAHYVIKLNDQPIAALATREQCEQAIYLVREKYAPNVPSVVHFTQGEPTISPLIRQHMMISTLTGATEKLDERVTVTMRGEGIFVNGSPLVMVASRFEALRTLELLQDDGAAGRPGIPTFKERIVIAPYDQQPGLEAIPVFTPEQAAKELTHPPRPQYCTVELGDSFYSIAMARGLTVNQIKELNPGVDPGTLHVGDKVRLPDILAPVNIEMR
ncbi:MAG TPA: LysM domain-containing protein [Armatimonadota bacterium]|nr:LysM domain-containing protein [Armatimonadota bacterium]